jgi:hypothetical protein
MIRMEIGFITPIFCLLAALFVVETCSRTNSTLRYFSSSRLAIEQNLGILKPI